MPDYLTCRKIEISSIFRNFIVPIDAWYFPEKVWQMLLRRASLLSNSANLGISANFDIFSPQYLEALPK